MKQFNKTNLYIRKAIALFFIFIGLVILLNIFTHPKARVISPLQDPLDTSQQQPTKKLNPNKKKYYDPQILRSKIVNAIQNKWKNYSVLVEDFNSPFTMGINETTIFTAASVNKIPIAITLYSEANNGTIDLDKQITIQPKDIQDYGTGSIRYDKPNSSYSIKTLARLMLSQSDNTAAYVLGTFTVGIPTIQKNIESLGLIQTNMETNKTSNADMAMLLKKLYTNQIIPKPLVLELLSFMTHTDFETRLPGKLPTNVKIAHKIGTEIGNLHDVGIIMDTDLAYYIGIFTSDITDETETEQLEASISRIIYDYMSFGS